ncbi:hypothetical protein OROMI_011219 [Orobanche minor]
MTKATRHSSDTSPELFGDLCWSVCWECYPVEIPHRNVVNSKITHLLQDSLGGDSRTLMFVQISSNENDLSETICSLNFASRVRGIELGPAKKQMDRSELFKHKQMVEKLGQDLKSKDFQIKKLEDANYGLKVKMKEKYVKNRNLQDKGNQVSKSSDIFRKIQSPDRSIWYVVESEVFTIIVRTNSMTVHLCDYFWPMLSTSFRDPSVCIQTDLQQLEVVFHLLLQLFTIALQLLRARWLVFETRLLREIYLYTGDLVRVQDPLCYYCFQRRGRLIEKLRNCEYATRMLILSILASTKAAEITTQ